MRRWQPKRCAGFGEIYAIAGRIRGRPAEQRVAVRKAETKPLMTALWPWLMQRLEEISAKSSVAKAIRYTLGHWEGLTVFLLDGRVEVDNNTVERGIRPILSEEKTHCSPDRTAAVNDGPCWRR